MANSYYNNTNNTIIDGTLASASDVEDKCDDIAAGFDVVEADIGEALTLSGVDVTSRDIPDLAAVRANTAIGFDSAGVLALIVQKGTYKGDWTTATFYSKDDTVKDAVGTAGYGADAILVCLTTHTSTDLISDAANWDAFIDTSDLEQAVIDAQAAQAAAEAAQVAAELAETNADGSATAAQLSAWEAEAEALTATSYAVQVEDSFVNVYTSDGDGTFTATPTTDYSALHWAAKSLAADPNLKADKVLLATVGDIATLDAAGNLVDGGTLLSDVDAHMVDTTNPHSVTQTQVGLGNVDNTSDVNKPVSTAQAAYTDLQAIVFAIALG